MKSFFDPAGISTMMLIIMGGRRYAQQGMKSVFQRRLGSWFSSMLMLGAEDHARRGRPGSGANHVLVRSGNIRLSWSQRRHIIFGERLDGVQLQEFLKVYGEPEEGNHLPEE
jgi:hypothetical protein